MCTSFSWIKYLAGVCSIASMVSGHGRMIDPPQRSSLWREGWEVPKNYEDHSLNCGGFWHQWGEMDGKCGICGDPYDSDRPNEAGGRYANGIIARTYDSTNEFIEVTIEVTASVGGYFEFKLCPHNDIYKPVKQSCLDQYPLRIEGNKRRLYIDLPLGKSGFVITKLSIPQGVTCKQCVLQWKWHGGNHWGMCTNGIGLSGCGPQTEFYNCADISILPSASSRDSEPVIKPRQGIPKQHPPSSLTNKKAPSVMTFTRTTTAVSSVSSTRRNFRSETTPITSTQNTTSTTVRTTPEYSSRTLYTPDIRTTLKFTSRQSFTPNIKTNSLAINTTLQSTSTATNLLSTSDRTEYDTARIPLTAKSVPEYFSPASLSSDFTISTKGIGEVLNSGLLNMSKSTHNITSVTEEIISTPDAEISTATTRTTDISTSKWTPQPSTNTADSSIRTSPNAKTTTVTTTTQSTTSTTKPTTTTTGTSTPISTSMRTTTTAVRSTTAPQTTTTTSAVITLPETIKTTTTAQSTSSMTTQPITQTTAMPLTTYKMTPTPIIERKSTSQTKSTAPATLTTTPILSRTRTIDLTKAATGSPKISQTISSSTFNPALPVSTFTKALTATTSASTTTTEIHPSTTIFQTTRAKEATIIATTKVIDKSIVRGMPPARREGGLSVATLFPFDLTRNLIDPSNSGINTEIKPVRRPGSNSLFKF